MQHLPVISNLTILTFLKGHGPVSPAEAYGLSYSGEVGQVQGKAQRWEGVPKCEDTIDVSYFFWFCKTVKAEAVARRCSVRKVFLEIPQNTQENTCARISFLIELQAQACNFIKRETLSQVFFCEFCETPLVAASGKDYLT